MLGVTDPFALLINVRKWVSDSLWLWGSQFFVAVMVPVPHGYGVLIFHGFGGPGPQLGFPILCGYDGPSAP